MSICSIFFLNLQLEDFVTILRRFKSVICTG